MPNVKRRFCVVYEERDDGVFVSVQVEIPAAGQVIRHLERERVDDMCQAHELEAHAIHECDKYPLSGSTPCANSDQILRTDVLRSLFGKNM